MKVRKNKHEEIRDLDDGTYCNSRIDDSEKLDEKDLKGLVRILNLLEAIGRIQKVDRCA